MKIQNKVLLSVEESDIVNGVFENHEVVAVADGVLSEMKTLTAVILPNVVKIGNYCLSSNASLTTVTLRYDELKVKCVDGDCFVYQSKKTNHGCNIYSGYVLVNMTKGKIKSRPCFVAEKNKSMDTVTQ